MKKAALHNLGCKVNAYETEAMQQLLEQAGYEIVPFTEQADVYVINTCSVTNMADRKSRQMLHKAKKENPDSIVVAAGCYVQTSSEEAARDLSVDIIIGNDKKHELVELIENCMNQKKNANEETEGVDDWKENICDINEKGRAYEALSISRTEEHTRAFLKVQDGCNQFCTYCIIPYARGRIRSRKAEEVVHEVETLAANGCKEVVLTGIHLSSYGLDHGDNLLHLIQEVHKVEGIRRIRLGSLEPGIIDENFVKELAKLEKICPHFHLSLQSGCDATLKRMNRKYDTATYEAGCKLIRKYFTHPAITTDVIVGFPGETEEEFEATKEFLERIHFYEMHIFKYSKRAGTRAAVMSHQVPDPVKTTRSGELLAMEKEQSKRFRAHYLGREAEVLLEEIKELDGVEYLLGHTRDYVKVAVPLAENGEKAVTNTVVRGTVEGFVNDEILLLSPLEFSK